MPGRQWTKVEVEFMRLHADRLTAEAMGERLARSASAVRQLATRNDISLVAGRATSRDRFYHPGCGRVQVGSRTLIAKTCTKCGRLLPARRYGRSKNEKRRGHWNSACRSCCIEGHTKVTPPTRKESYTKHRDKIEQYTRGLAVNLGEPWTSEDLAVVRDVEKSLIEVAVAVGRTYGSIAAKARELGVNRRPNPDQHRDWVVLVDRESVESALRAERAAVITPTRIPSESDWDWDEASVSA